MSTKHRARIVIAVIGLIMLTLACALPGATPQATQPTATPTPGLSTGGNTGGTGANTGGTGGSNGGTGGNSGSTGGNSGGTSGSNNNSPTQLATIYSGPYVVKQIETLGGEAISGFVCSVTQPFSVLSATPHVTFTFAFVPKDAQHGNVSYAYSVPRAGESHDASGTYTLSPVDKAGTLQLSLAVSDHVVFKGFDGNIPNRYKFNLVPSGDTSCPHAP